MPFALKADGYTRNEDPPSVQAAREAWVNLLMHMDYFDAKGAVVKCYDDQILFRNAGCLRFPIERIEQHLTEPRNPIIAKVFRLLGWADRSGSGIEKITKGWTSRGYNKPAFQDDKTVNMFEVIFPLIKKGSEKVTDRVTEKVTDRVTENQHKILDAINNNPNVTASELAKILGISERKTKENIKKLKERLLLKRIGPDKGGHWEVVG